MTGFDRVSRVLKAVARFAEEKPEKIAIEAQNACESIDYQALNKAVARLAERFKLAGIGPCALLADNTPAWAIADLAAIRAGIPLIPVPHFFSPAQIRHLLVDAGVNVLLTDQPDPVRALLDRVGLAFDADGEYPAGKQSLTAFRLRQEQSPNRLPEGCAKVTYTSGSTGDPKGVCLSQEAMEKVAASVAQASDARADDRHLAALPYATLLENVGGLYAPLLVGGTVCALGMSAVGWSGASGLDAQRFVGVLKERQISTCIMIPQMLLALVTAIESGMPRPDSLRYLAVGGAPVSEHLLRRAEKLGLPVFEGYGLSEAASVVAVNRPGANKPGTVGRVLPHVDLKLAEDGEILVRGSLFLGYLGDKPWPEDDFWPTGDIGELDEEGFLRLVGRKKHLFITAFGRNVAPEWVERELTVEPAIAQACVFGEARPFNVAVIYPREGSTPEMIEEAIASANKRLPDYARVSRWLLAREPFSVENGMWTGTGRPRRRQIHQAYRAEIDAIYEEEA